MGAGLTLGLDDGCVVSDTVEDTVTEDEADGIAVSLALVDAVMDSEAVSLALVDVVMEAVSLARSMS